MSWLWLWFVGFVGLAGLWILVPASSILLQILVSLIFCVFALLSIQVWVSHPVDVGGALVKPARRMILEYFRCAMICIAITAFLGFFLPNLQPDQTPWVNSKIIIATYMFEILAQWRLDKLKEKGPSHFTS